MRKTGLCVFGLAFGLLLVAGAPAVALAQAGAGQPAARPNEEALKAVTDLGKRIASYHEGIEKCRAALKQQRADLEDARGVMVERNGVLHVVFLKQDAGPAEPHPWMLVADAVFQAKAGEPASLQVIDPFKVPPGDAAGFLRAFDTARTAAANSAHLSPPFLEAGFKDKGTGTYTIYLQTKPEGARAVRFGGDLVVRMAADALTVSEVRPLHDAAVTVQVPARAGTEPTLHSHATGDLPAETDVAAILEHPTLAPHLVLTPRYMFRIEGDGSIAYIGPNSAPPAASGGAR